MDELLRVFVLAALLVFVWEGGNIVSVYVGMWPALHLILIPCNSARLELQLHCMESTLVLLFRLCLLCLLTLVYLFWFSIEFL